MRTLLLTTLALLAATTAPAQLSLVAPVPANTDPLGPVTVIEPLDQILFVAPLGAPESAYLFDRDLTLVGSLPNNFAGLMAGFVGVAYHPTSDTIYWMTGTNGSSPVLLIRTDLSANILEQHTLPTPGRNLSVSVQGNLIRRAGTLNALAIEELGLQGGLLNSWPDPVDFVIGFGIALSTNGSEYDVLGGVPTQTFSRLDSSLALSTPTCTTSLASIGVSANVFGFATSLYQGQEVFYFVAPSKGEIHRVPTGCVVAPPPPQFMRGDCNNDGGRSLPDVIVLLQALFPPGPVAPLACQSACDANDDGSLALPDAIVLLTYLFQSGPLAMPAACGSDPTPDMLSCGPTTCR